MKILFAIFCLYLLAYLAVGCTAINGNDTQNACVTIRNWSADTIRVESKVDTARIDPHDSLDLAYAVGGVHRIALALPQDTLAFFVHVETERHHSYIDYPATR